MKTFTNGESAAWKGNQINWHNETLTEDRFYKNERENFGYFYNYHDSPMMETLYTRLSQGLRYTSLGPILVENEYNAEGDENFYKIDEKSPHLFNISRRAYNSLISTQASQGILNLGKCSNNYTNLDRQLDHLLYLSSKQESSKILKQNSLFIQAVKNSIKLINLFGTSIYQNVDVTYTGIAVQVFFDIKHRLVGSSIRAKLLDPTFLSTNSDKNYPIFNNIFSLLKSLPSNPMLNPDQKYKLISKELQNSENILEIMNSLKIKQQDIQKIKDSLAMIVLLFEITFTCGKFTLAGQNNREKWVPKANENLSRLCRAFNVSQEVFVNFFGNAGSKREAEIMVLDLARLIYRATFDWLVTKIDEMLDKLSGSVIQTRKSLSLSKDENEETYRGTYSISLVNFPNFDYRDSLGGLYINWALESLKLFSCRSYFELIQAVKRQETDITYLSVPHCQNLIDTLFKPDQFVSNLSSDNFQRYWKEFIGNYQNKSIFNDFISTDSLLSCRIKFSYGEIAYNVSNLLNESQNFLPTSTYYPLISKPTNKILSRMLPKICSDSDVAHTSLYDTHKKSLSYLLNHLDFNCFLVYDITNSKAKYEFCEELNKGILLPIANWYYYGFPFWIPIVKLRKIMTKQNESLFQDVIEWVRYKLKIKDFRCNDELVMLKQEDFKHLTISNNYFSQISKKYENQISNSNSYFIILGHIRSQEYNFEAKALEKSYSQIDISFDKSYISNEVHKWPKNIRANYKPLRRTNSLILASNKTYNFFKRILSHFELFDYTDTLPIIIKIQSYYRGYLSRKYFRNLRHLFINARFIQKIWRGHKSRKTYKPIGICVAAIRKIQTFYRNRFQKLTKAAERIQKWYISIIRNRYKSSVTSIATVEITPFQEPASPYLMLHTAHRYYVRQMNSAGKSPQKKYTFSPVISKKTREFAEKYHNRHGSLKFDILDKFKMYETIKSQKIEEERKKASESTATLISYKKSSESSGNYNDFYRRMKEKQDQYQSNRDLLIHQKIIKEKDTLTFSPNIKKSRSTSFLKFSERLNYTPSKERKESDETSFISEKPNLLSDKSREIAENRQRKLRKASQLQNEIFKSFQPLWPH
ncbi:unnamed protein product [Blepharisma stoltei]|uniref:Myosin motor domain-containing protein n=1 Tax=Blepharisma stoltei TaxID=1481888 RepID=A0AAU9ICC6_9CILI|nr:unnamed protein product [Blepharisma stoltei]